MLIGGFSPPKLVKSRVKRGSRNVFVRYPKKKIAKGVDRGQFPFLPSMGGCHAKRANAVCDQMKLGYISVLVAHAPLSTLTKQPRKGSARGKLRRLRWFPLAMINIQIPICRDVIKIKNTYTKERKQTHGTP